MLTIIISILSGFIICALLVAGIYFSRRKQFQENLLDASKQVKQLLHKAKNEAKNLRKTTILNAKEEWYGIKKKQEDQIAERQKELRIMEKKYNERISSLDKRLDILDKKESNLLNLGKKNKNKEEELSKQKNHLDKLIGLEEKKLSEIAQLSQEEAFEILTSKLKNEARNRAAGEVKRILDTAKTKANVEAAGIVAQAIQRLAVDHVSESTVAVVSLPNDEMKGRIIGREGRNIRAFEKASGVDLIIDDTPEAVVLSCFDPIRREIARMSLEKLIVDGRIHPGRIEEVIGKTIREMDDNIIKIGEQACLEVNIHNISPNIIKILGRLHYRTSYGQNVLQHSIEAAWVCGMMAAELGLNQEIARRAGFLHDIGKAIDHEFDGSHAVLGANIARKNGESKTIINAIEAHHEDVEAQSVYAVLTQASDAVSGARPGARREMLESYMQRLDKLEEIANSIEGVHKSFAIQAGRELRIIVDPSIVNDGNTVYIASDIAKKIEKEMQYPGMIKVVVIRETRQTVVAK